MKLIDLLVRDLPGLDGWADVYLYAAQDKDGAICQYKTNPYFDGSDCWGSPCGVICFGIFELSEDWNKAIITREQYEAALEAASKPEAEVKKIIGKFTPILWGDSDCRKGFYVKTMTEVGVNICSGMDDIGAEYNVDKKYWRFEPVWDGEGLPPVGSSCESSWCGANWLPCEILFIGQEKIVVKLATREESYDIGTVAFRSIRTEADRRREASVEAIMDCNDVTCRFTAKIIYDAIAAGKIPGVRLDDEAGR